MKRLLQWIERVLRWGPKRSRTAGVNEGFVVED